YPLGKAQRDRLLARVDALLATTSEVAKAAQLRFPGDFKIVSQGVDTRLFRPARKRNLIVVEWDPAERPAARAAIRARDERPGWELILLRRRPLSGRPTIPRRLRDRVHVRTALDAASRAAILGPAKLFVSAPHGSTGRRTGPTEPALADRNWIICDLHMHTDWSHDCSVEVDELLDYAEEQGLGAIAITDHNKFGGALEAVEKARGRNLVVIPGEEIKTDRQGEVIGLFLQEEIPPRLSFADTLAAIRAQGGLVYLPHP